MDNNENKNKETDSPSTQDSSRVNYGSYDPYNPDPRFMPPYPGYEPQKPWYSKKDDTEIPEGYNPYRAEHSVFFEVYEENKNMLLGTEPLEYEPPHIYAARRAHENVLLKNGAFKRLKKDSGFVSLILLLTLAMMYALSFGIAFLQGAVSDEVFDVITTALMVVQYVAIFPVVFYVATLGKKNKTRTYFQKPEVSAFYILRWTVISIGLVYAASIAFNIIFSILESMGVYVNDLSSPLPDTVLEFILYFLAVVICAPLFEELLFRGILMTRLMRFGGWFSAITTGILFGVFHQNHEQMFYAAAFGILLGFIDIKAGSIIPSIIAHVIFNVYAFVSTVVLSFTNYEECLADPSIALDGPAIALYLSNLLDFIIYALIVVAIIALVIEIVRDRSQFKLPKGDSGLNKGEKLSGYIAHGATVAFIIFMILTITANSFINFEAIFELIE